jgi:hypothetical protein
MSEVLHSLARTLVGCSVSIANMRYTYIASFVIYNEGCGATPKSLLRTIAAYYAPLVRPEPWEVAENMRNDSPWLGTLYLFANSHRIPFLTLLSEETKNSTIIISMVDLDAIEARL